MKNRNRNKQKLTKMDLPKQNRSSKIGKIGLSIVQVLVESDLGWIFRRNHQEDDFGIDGYIDVITNQNQLSGKSLAVQVKCGQSYLNEKNDIGYIYRGELAHLNYYLNHDIPVIIILVDEQKRKAFWAKCQIEKTQKTSKNWKMTIPFNHALGQESKEKLESFIGPVRDYAGQFENFWKFNNILKSHEKIIFTVDKDSIENGTYTDLLEGIQRLLVNEELLSHVKEKVDIWINDYDFDPRELYEIPEVVDWVKKVFEGISGWAYLLYKGEGCAFIKMLTISFVPYEIKSVQMDGPFGKRRWIQFDNEKLVGFQFNLFMDLNGFTDAHNIPLEINQKISRNLTKCLMGEQPSI